MPSRSQSIPTASNDWKRGDHNHDEHRPTAKYDVGTDHDHRIRYDHSTYDWIGCCWE